MDPRLLQLIQQMQAQRRAPVARFDDGGSVDDYLFDLPSDYYDDSFDLGGLNLDDFNFSDLGTGGLDLGGLDFSDLDKWDVDVNAGSGFENLDLGSFEDLAAVDELNKFGTYDVDLGSFEDIAAVDALNDIDALANIGGGTDVTGGGAGGTRSLTSGSVTGGGAGTTSSGTYDDDTEPGSSGGTQGSEGPAGAGSVGQYAGSSYSDTGTTDSGTYDDDTEPGSSGGTQGSQGPAGGTTGGDTDDDTGGSGTYDDDTEPGSSGGTGGSHPGGGPYTDDTEPGSSGGTQGSQGPAGGTGTSGGTTGGTTGGGTTGGGTTGGGTTGGKKDLLSTLLPMLLMMLAMNRGGGGSRASTATIPELKAVRKQTPYSKIKESPDYRPGQAIRYFEPTRYEPKTMAGGGIVDLARALAAKRREQRQGLLKGRGDGVSDSIPGTIDGQRPARLARGEYVVDARTVAELGNGSTDAGAERLDEMRRRVHDKRKKAGVGQNSKAYKHLPK